MANGISEFADTLVRCADHVSKVQAHGRELAKRFAQTITNPNWTPEMRADLGGIVRQNDRVLNDAAGWLRERANELPPELAVAKVDLLGVAGDIGKENAPRSLREIAVKLESPPTKTRLIVNHKPPHAVLDGTPWPITEKQVDLLQSLIDANGEYVSLAPKFRTRDVEALPDAIRELIETQPGAGTRIPLSKLLGQVALTAAK